MLLRGALKVMAVAQAAGATIVFEWPRGCDFWRDKRVIRMIRRFGLMQYDFDGCMYGIQSVVSKTLGLPIRKPWRIVTNSPTIGRAFSQKCDGSHPKHAPCSGGDTRHTESYSKEFAVRFHTAFRAHLAQKYPCFPACPPPLFSTVTGPVQGQLRYHGLRGITR